MSLPDAPNTLREKYYSVMAGQNDADILPDIETAPSTENRYLDYIARNGGGGGGDDEVWLGTRAEHTAAETAGTLPETAIIGITDEEGGGDIIDDEHVSTETTYSSSKIETMFSDLYTKSFAHCSDEDLVAILAAADRGEANPSNYWAVGDTREVQLPEILPTTGVDETQPAQYVELLIVHQGLYKDANDKTVNFIVHLKESLQVAGKMNTTKTNAGSWDSCPRRTWCNTNFYNAIPNTIRSIFKQFKTITATEYNSSQLTTSLDYFSLPAEKEIYGFKKYATDEEAAALTQWDFYKVSSNRPKQKSGSSGVTGYWLRSPDVLYNTYFCFCSNPTIPGGNDANNTSMCVAPFGCI